MDFYDFAKKNGLEAFDKMADEMAKKLNEARARYEADQKKEADAQALAEKKDKAMHQVRDALGMVYPQLGEKLDAVVEAIFEAVNELAEVLPKVEILRDETDENGNKVFAARIRDCGDLYDKDLWDLLLGKKTK